MDNASLIQYLDLTSLNDSDTEKDIENLCQTASTPKGNVAAVCVYGQFVDFAKKQLAGSNIKVATVANFPEGKQNLATTCNEVETLIHANADEIDLVIDYQSFINGNKHCIYQLVHAVKGITENKYLKVILETGELSSSKLIDYASKSALDAGADFLKTSTGKVAINATLEAAQIMLSAIQMINYDAGFKAAGGVKTPEQAKQYVELATKTLGDDWLTPSHFRIGASSLLNSLI